MIKPKSAATAELLNDLQRTLAQGNIQQRLDAMRRITDLFLKTDVVYSREQVSLFDDVYLHVLARLESDARLMLSHRLCHADNAPPKTIRALAFDDDIRIAAPVLTNSPQLSDKTLAENARCKSQLHLLAIAARKLLGFVVTDALLARGNDAVIAMTACNAGANFSEAGYTLLAKRANKSEQLAQTLSSRGAVPRHHYLALIARASANVRDALQRSHPQWRDEISAIVFEAASRARRSESPANQTIHAADQLVRSLHDEGRINDAQIAAFISRGRFDEAVSGIACLSHLSRDTAEALLMDTRSEGLLIVCKAATLSWATLVAFVQLRHKLFGTGDVSMPADIDQPTYDRLRETTAQQVLRFHRIENEVAETGKDVQSEYQPSGREHRQAEV